METRYKTEINRSTKTEAVRETMDVADENKTTKAPKKCNYCGGRFHVT